MIDKVVANVHEALQGIDDGMTLMLGGFGLCGIPENSIAELVKKKKDSKYCVYKRRRKDIDLTIKNKCESNSLQCQQEVNL